MQPENRWPHWLAWVLACAVFPLIFLGGSVTTYEAGMAVPDWPTTEGHWFYPLQGWVAAAWDFFLEHGHRMLAQVVGLLSIVLAVALWKFDRRKWMRWLGVVLVAGVIFQGVLGGLRVVGGRVVGWLEATHAPAMGLLRVIGDADLLKKIHGCTAPLVFALCVALVIFTSRRWLETQPPRPYPTARRLRRLALTALLGIYLLIVLGAQLRHLPAQGALLPNWLSAGLMTTWFELWVWVKLLLAGLTAVVLAWALLGVRRTLRAEPLLVRRTSWLGAIFLVQLVLGAGTWVTNYNWPGWFTRYVWALQYTPVAEGRLQVCLTTAHAALGSLALGAALSVVLWSRRLLQGESR